MALTPGTTFGRYRIIDRIGAGSVAIVFKAYDNTKDREVAVKVLRDSLASVVHERFFREASATAHLRHPNILPIFDVGTVEGSSYYVMPYVAGGSLDDLLKEKGALPVEAALALSVAIAGALDYAHESGIIHRDLKPSNVLLPTSNFHDAVLTDFGLHGILDVSTRQTMTTGEMFGTPVYMSPEQVRGEPQSAATDTFGLGVLLYQMVYGKTPFDGDSVLLLMHRTLTEPVSFPSKPTIRPELRLFISRCLEKTPDRRPTSPLAELRRLGALPTLGERRILVVQNDQWFGVRRRHLAMMGGGLAGTAIASTFIALNSSPTIRQATIGLTLMLAGVALGLSARRWLQSRRDVVSDEAAEILTGTRDRDVLTQSLAICVDQILERCKSLDEKILGRSLAIMVDEVRRAQDFDDRHRALTAAVDFLEKLMTRLTPWYVKYEKLIAVVVMLVGIIPGMLTIAQTLWRD